MFVRLSDRIFQFRAQSLLEGIQQIELRKSTWQDAQRIRERNSEHVSTDAACSEKRCDITITLDHWYKFLSSSNGNSRFARFVWTWRLPGGRWAFIHATLRIRDGVVWGKDFDATISHRDDYPLIATAETTRDFATTSWYVSQDSHPNIRFGRPGGREICQALWVKITPNANPKEMQEAFAFDLACIGGTLRRCTEMSQIMTVAARRLGENSRANDVAHPPLTWSPAMIRALARDAQNAAVADILRVHPETSDEPQSVDYKVVEALKGDFGVPIQRAALSRRPTIDVRKVPQHAIVFGFERNDNPAFVPLTDDNLHPVRAGIAEDSVDIPQKW
ncbi:MAG TPA: hypothetical protein VMH03_04590 [Terriglobales bacterium]|nr:hypothetical protein [Terriglobales bacterium]